MLWQILQSLSNPNRINKYKNISTSSVPLFSTLVRMAAKVGPAVKLDKKIQVFEMKCYRRLLGIPYTAHRTNNSVIAEITTAIGEYKHLHTTQTLLGLTMQTRSTGLVNTILQDSVEGKQGRRRSRTCPDNIATWACMSHNQLLQTAGDRHKRRELVHISSSVPPTIFKVKGQPELDTPESA